MASYFYYHGLKKSDTNSTNVHECIEKFVRGFRPHVPVERQKGKTKP